MTRNPLTSDMVPAPVGPFSLAVRGGGLLFFLRNVTALPLGAAVELDVVV